MADGVAEDDRVLAVAHGVVVLSNEIGEDVMKRTHGNTSSEMSQALHAWQDVGGRVDRPDGYEGVVCLRECARPSG